MIFPGVQRTVPPNEVYSDWISDMCCLHRPARRMGGFRFDTCPLRVASLCGRGFCVQREDLSWPTAAPPRWPSLMSRPMSRSHKKTWRCLEITDDFRGFRQRTKDENGATMIVSPVAGASAAAHPSFVSAAEAFAIDAVSMVQPFRIACSTMRRCCSSSGKLSVARRSASIAITREFRGEDSVYGASADSLLLWPREYRSASGCREN